MKREVARSYDHLKELIDDAIDKYGPNCDLNWIDTSLIQNMSCLFYNSDFNGDISKWNVSNVTHMSQMFTDSKFTGDISNWNVSKVKTMYCMFYGSQFNGDISNWNVGNVKIMDWMFAKAQFNGNITNWLPAMKKNRIAINGLCLPDNSLSMKLYRKQQKIDQIILEGA